MKRKILFGINILILILVAIFTFIPISNGHTEVANGFRWYYEVKDGEAVNVRMQGSYDKIDKLIIPSTLGGYPVTSIRGVSIHIDPIDAIGVDNGTYYINWSGTNQQLHVPYVEEVVLPDTIREIGAYAFYNCKTLTKVNMPKNLETIGEFAFCYTNIKELKLDGLKYIDRGAFNYSKLEKVEITNMNVIHWFGTTDTLKSINIGKGVKCINGFGYFPNATDVRISSDVERIVMDAFTGMSDVYVDKDEKDIEIVYPYGSGHKVPYYHFNNKETVTFDGMEGVKLIDVNTKEEITNNKYETGSNVTFKLEQEEGYNYNDYIVYMESFGQYYDDEKIVEELPIKFGENYTIENITRNKKIYFQKRKKGFDLALRQYIKSINSVDMAQSREPKLEVKNGQASYYHTKNIVYPKNGDNITLCVRVYNEGTEDGTATEISEYIPEGMKFNETSELNKQYGWQISEDGRTATTSYLKDTTINKYTIYDLKSTEIYIDLVVDTEETDELNRKVCIAEITGATGTDVDSNIKNIETPVSNTYKQEESENSNTDSYIPGTEDDDDFENIATSRKIPLPHSLVINKIDGIDSELLNGATFDLLDENKNVVKTGVTAQGGVLDFGKVYTFGEGKTTFYIKETYTPEGYKNHLKYLIQVDIINKYSAASGLITNVELDIKDIDIDTSIYKTINISTKEELKAIESNKAEKYVLTNDIDLGGENWTPLNVSNVKLDGNGHKITNLKIDSNNESINKFGLFGTYSGIIENLTLDNVDIDVTNTREAKEEAEETEDDIDAVGAFIGYSERTILKNCNVTGTVDSTLRNVGGLVGHTKSETIIVARNCSNGAVITASSHNIGGILGCALGPVKVYNCVNNAQIKAQSYNVSGIVGYSRPEGYTMTQVLPNVNDNQVVNIAVKNDSINSSYKLKIEKIDEKGNLLNGAKFQILDNSKKTIKGYEAAEVKDGILELPQISVDSIGTDVYYLKEVEAPEGYEMLTNHYIKVSINKKWNKEKSEYYIESSVKELTNEELEKDVIEKNNTSEVKTQLTYEDKVNNVKLNIIETEIENSENKAVISNVYKYTNTAGILGFSKGRTLVNGSKNNGAIKSESNNVRVSGIIGGIERNWAGDVAEIKNCSNLVNVEAVTIEGTEDIKIRKEGMAAGILAFARIELIMDSNINSGELTSNCSAGGILGNAVGDIDILNCSNLGKISSNPLNSSTGEVAGIFAQNYDYEEDKWDINEIVLNGITNIENCINTANIEINKNSDNYITYHSSGILGLTDAKETNINNCKVNDCTVYGPYDVAGVVPFVRSNSTNINNCIINNSTITGGTGITSGIMGGLQTCYIESFLNKDLSINISKCNILNSNIIGESRVVSGIEGFGGYNGGSFEPIPSNISECNVENSKIICNGQDSRDRESVSGIYGSSYEENIVTIDSCNLTNSVVEGNRNVQGICAGGYEKSSAKIYRCNVTKSKIICKDGVINDNYGSGPFKAENANVSGIYGAGFEEKNIIIDSCKLIDSLVEYENSSNYNTNSINVGGMYAGGWNGEGWYGDYHADISILNNEVTNCKIYNNCNSQSSYTNTAGILANTYISGNNSLVNLDNNKVYNCDIKSNDGNIAGLCNIIEIGCGSIGTISNCTVEKVNIERNGEEYDDDDGCVGGLIGGINLNSQISNCKVLDCNIYNKTAKNTAGMVALSSARDKKTGNFAPIKLYNCDVLRTKIKHEIAHKNEGSTAGFMAIPYSGMEAYNCSVKDTSIDSNSHQVAGIVVYPSNGKVIIDGTTVDNVKFKQTTDKGDSSLGGFYACHGWNSNNSEIKNCKLLNSTLESSAETIAGIIGVSWNKDSVNGCVVENNTIIAKSDKTNNFDPTVGGLSGVSGNYCSDSDFSNNTISGLTINIESSVPTCTGSLMGCGYGGQEIKLDGTKVNNISINNKSNGCSGGLIGNIFSSNSTKIPKLDNYNNINVNGNNGNTGGLIGFTKYGVKVEALTGNNMTLNGSYIGGLIGCQQEEEISEFKNINLSDLTANGSSCVGGIIGFTNGNIKVDTYTGNDININGGNHSGGIVGMACGRNDSEIENIIINDESVNGYSYAGGITGLIVNPRFKNINMTDINIISNSVATGIVAAMVTKTGNCYSDNSVDSRAEFNGITINKSQKGNNSVNGNSQYTGILLGFGKVVTDNINISDVNINNEHSSASVGTIGMTEKDSDIKNITVDNVNISTSQGSAGEIVGFSKSNIKLCTVSNSIIKIIGGTDNKVGGIAGILIIPDSTEVQIKDCCVNNTVVECENSNTYIGGIVGFTSNTISGCSTTGSTITSAGTESKGKIGGIAGMQSLRGSTVVQINDCHVSNSSVNSKNVYTGGIAGFSDNTISGCITTDSNITSTATERRGTGGILGHGSNCIGVDTSIINSKVIDSSISGNVEVGGITGGAVAKIQNCYVGGKDNEKFPNETYAVKITGNSCVGGIIGDAGVINNDSYLMLTMSGTSVNNTLIKGNENVDYLVGIHGRFNEEYTTGTQTESILTSTYKDCKISENK